jgi:hypothetical protein
VTTAEYSAAPTQYARTTRRPPGFAVLDGFAGAPFSGSTILKENPPCAIVASAVSGRRGAGAVATTAAGSALFPRPSISLLSERPYHQSAAHESTAASRMDTRKT